MIDFKQVKTANWSYLFLNILMMIMLAFSVSIHRAMGATFLLMFIISLFSFRKNINQKLHAFEKTWLILLLCFFISTIVSLYFSRLDTFRWNSLDVPFRFILVIPVYLLLKRVMLSEKMFWVGVLIGSISAGAIGIYQHSILNIYRTFGETNNPIVYGNVSICLAMISLVGFLSFNKGSILRKSIFMIGVISGLVASLLSGARGGWIALPIVFTYWLWVNRGTLGKYKQISIILVFTLATVFLFQFEKIGISDRFNQAVNDVKELVFENNKQTSIGVRIEMIRATWLIFKENPWLGSGPDTFIQQTNKVELEKKVVFLNDQ